MTDKWEVKKSKDAKSQHPRTQDLHPESALLRSSLPQPPADDVRSGWQRQSCVIVSQEAEGQERRAGDKPPASFPLRPAPEGQQRQRRHCQHKALVLHDAAKANEIPVDRQEQRGNLPVPPVEPAPAQQVEGHDAQKTGEREGQPGLPFVDRARECPGGHGEQDLSGTLLVIEQLCIVPQDGAGGPHHHDALVALELAVAQVEQAEECSKENDK